MKNNNLVGIAAIIIALSVGYYYVLYLPQKDKEDRSQQIIATNQKNIEKCTQLEELKLTKYKQSVLSLGGKLSGFESSSSHYNTKLGKCIVEITDVSLSGGKSFNYVEIQDAAEDRDIAACPSLVVGDGDSSLCYTNDINGSSTDISEAQFKIIERASLTE